MPEAVLWTIRNMVNKFYNRESTNGGNVEHPGILQDKYAGKKDITPEMVAALRNGDPDAYKAVYLRFYEPLSDFLSALIHDKAEGEEIAQETMADLWENRDKLDPDRNVSGYIYTIGRNAALQHLRRRKVRISYANDYLNWGQTDVSGDETILAQETELLIRMKICQLPEQKRRIYEMHREQGMTYEDIASELGISVNTVKYHMKSILKELRETLMLFFTLLLLS